MLGLLRSFVTGWVVAVISSVPLLVALVIAHLIVAFGGGQ